MSLQYTNKDIQKLNQYHDRIQDETVETLNP